MHILGGITMKNLIMGQVTMNVSSVVGVNVHPETIVAARIILLMPNGKEVELSVNEVLEMDLNSYDPITGYGVDNPSLNIYF